MTLTVAPSVEAVRAIRDRLNSSTAYELIFVASVADEVVDPLEEISELRVDVVHESEEQLMETLDDEDRTSHVIRIWIRSKLEGYTADFTDQLKLLVRQIFQRVNEYDATDGRVKVWECDREQHEVPVKQMWRQHGLFVASVVLRAEVEPS